MISLRHRVERFENGLNPVMVKELRQAVNGQIIAGVFTVFLAAMMLIFIVSASQSLHRGLSNTGQDIVQMLVVVMSFCFAFVLPLIAGGRTHHERHTGHMALMVGAGLRFKRIFWGKFLSLLTVEAVILSTILPFALAATYLRGVDVPTVMMATGWVVITSGFCIAMAIGLGCQTMGVVSILLATAFGLAFGGIGAVLGGVGAIAILEGGLEGGAGFLAGSCTCVGLVLAVTMPLVLAGASEKINHNRTDYHHPTTPSFYDSPASPADDRQRSRAVHR